MLDGGGKIIAIAQGVIILLPFQGAILNFRGGPVFKKIGLQSDCDKNLKEFIAKIIGDLRLNYRYFYLNAKFFSEKSPRSEIALQESLLCKLFLERDPYLTYIVKLEENIAENIKKFDSKWRNQMRKAQGSDQEITFNSEDDSILKFVNLYKEMCELKGLKLNKNIKIELINIRDNLTDKFKVLIVHVNKIPVCGCIVLLQNTNAYYYLAASSKIGRDGNFSNLMIVSLLEKLKNYHVDKLDLVGIDPKKNWGTFNFKRGIGGYPLSYLGEWQYGSNPVIMLLFSFALYLKSRNLN